MIKTLPSVTVTGANTATKLTATHQRAHSVILYSLVGTIWIGDSSVNSTPGSERGVAIAATAAPFTLTEESSPNSFELSQIFVSSTNAAGKVGVAFTEA